MSSKGSASPLGGVWNRCRCHLVTEFWVPRALQAPLAGCGIGVAAIWKGILGSKGPAGPLAGCGAAHLGDAIAGPHQPLFTLVTEGDESEYYDYYFKFKEGLNQC
jgi:hypothetical protein